MIKKLTSALLCIAIISCSSCTRKNDDKGKMPDIDIIKLSSGEKWNDSLLSADEIVVSDSNIFIYSKQGETEIIHVYSPAGNLIASGIEYGNGPEEVLEVASLHQMQKNTLLYDGKAGKIYKLGIDGKDVGIENMADSLYLHDDAVMLPSQHILILPLNSSISYRLTNIQGNTIDSISYFPPKPEGVDDKTHRLACTGHLAVSPNGKTFVRALVYDGGLDFFSLDGDEIKHNNRHSAFDMEYGVLEGKISVPIPNEKSKTGYSHLYATDKHFLASFSESKALDNPDGECREIHIFDHDGNLLTKMLLDKSFTAFAIDKKEEFLYISSSEDEGNTIIYKYKVPKLSTY